MKRKINFGKKLSAGLFIFGMIVQNVFLFFPKPANAQGIEAFFGGELDASGLGATIISCVFPNGIVGALGGLFQGGGSGSAPTGGSGGGGSNETVQLNNNTFSGITGGSGSGSNDSVPVNDKKAIDAIKTADKNLSNNKGKQTNTETNGQIDQGAVSAIGAATDPDGVLVQIRAEAEKETKKERCLDKIAKYLATRMLDAITLSTVNWINSGFDGGAPLWLSDPNFFPDIAKEEINLVTWELTDPDKILQYPFGQAIMTSILEDLQRDFYAEARFSLNTVLANGSYEEFHEDFSVGGWAGYTDLFRPNNNPFGAYFDAQDHLSRRIEGTSISRAYNFRRELEEAGGFLSQRKCIVSGTGEDNYIGANDPNEGQFHVPMGGQIPDAVYQAANYDPEEYIPQTEEQAEIIDTYVLRSQCTKWKNLTPGGIISDQIKTAVKIPHEELFMVDELNESIGLILDALLTQLVTEGLESLSGTDPATNVVLAQVQGSQPGAVQNGISDEPTTGEVIIGGDINYALSQIQVYYMDNILIAQPVLEDLVEKIRALDFCVPGPNPNWQIESENNLVTTLMELTPFVAQPEDSDDDGDIEQSEIDDANDLNEAHYADLIESLTGMQIAHAPEMDSHDEFINFMENVFIKYGEEMLDNYSLNDPPPSARVLLDGLFDDLQDYISQLNFFADYMTNIGNVSGILSDVEAALNALAAGNGGVLDETDPAVQAQMSIYSQISDQLVSEQDLDQLVANIALYQAQVPVVDTHVNICIDQTVLDNTYPDPTQRVEYPFDYDDTYANMPAFDSNGFLPNIDGLGDGANSIDVSFGGVNITGDSNGLDTFEDELDAVY